MRSKEKFILGYAGGMAKSNALTALVEAASMVQNLPMEMVLVGKGTEKMHLLSLVKKYGLKQVHFLPPVSKDLVPDLLAQMDALYIGWQETKLYQYGVSANKIFDYMLAEKPILWAGNTGNNPVMEAQAGIAVSGQPADIAGAIRKMVAEDSRHLAQWGRNGSVYVKDKHNYRNLAEKFIHAIS